MSELSSLFLFSLAGAGSPSHDAILPQPMGLQQWAAPSGPRLSTHGWWEGCQRAGPPPAAVLTRVGSCMGKGKVREGKGRVVRRVQGMFRRRVCVCGGGCVCVAGHGAF